MSLVKVVDVDLVFLFSLNGSLFVDILDILQGALEASSIEDPYPTYYQHIDQSRYRY